MLGTLLTLLAVLTTTAAPPAILHRQSSDLGIPAACDAQCTILVDFYNTCAAPKDGSLETCLQICQPDKWTQVDACLNCIASSAGVGSNPFAGALGAACPSMSLPASSATGSPSLSGPGAGGGISSATATSGAAGPSGAHAAGGIGASAQSSGTASGTGAVAGTSAGGAALATNAGGSTASASTSRASTSPIVSGSVVPNAACALDVASIWVLFGVLAAFAL